MPLYEFDCLSCGQSFEKLVRSATAIDSVTCPECGQPHIRKKLSLFASGTRREGTTSASAAACAPGGT